MTEEEINAEAAGPHFGFRYVGALPENANERITVLDNPLIPGYPTPITVHLFQPDRDVPLDGLNCEAHARVTYSNGSVQNSFLCDWNGQFSIVCNKLTIELESYQPFANDLLAYDNLDQQFVYGALVGLGSSPSGGRDPIGYTAPGHYMGNPDDGSSPQVVPDFARRWTPILMRSPLESVGSEVSDADLAQMLVVFGQAVSGGYRQMVMRMTREILLHGLKVPGNVRKISLINQSSQVDYHVNHYFDLGL